MIEQEVWKDIPGYEGLYQVSNLGRVKTLYDRWGKERLLSSHKHNKGYLQIGLTKDNCCKKYKVHRLVAQAFLPNPNNLTQVNHKNENKQDNRVENLEWCDCKFNINYGTRNERVASIFAIPVIQLDLYGRFIKRWCSMMEAQREGFNSGSISNCCRGIMIQHRGYRWQYEYDYEHLQPITEALF